MNSTFIAWSPALLEVIGCIAFAAVVWVVVDLLATSWILLTRRRVDSRCGRCGYPTIGLPTAICPECGTDTSRQPKFRRHWRHLFLLWAVAVGWSVASLYAGLGAHDQLHAVSYRVNERYGVDRYYSGLPCPLYVVIQETQIIPNRPPWRAPATHVNIRHRNWPLVEGELRINLPDLKTPDGDALDVPLLRAWWAEQLGLPPEQVHDEALGGVVQFLAANAQIIGTQSAINYSTGPTRWVMTHGQWATATAPTTASDTAGVAITVAWFLGLAWFTKLQRRAVGRSYRATWMAS